ncbi:MAG: hypothetical protein JSR77_18755 [Planctomycetes bacterium]|nr:hypothetical protein [Planctomycetota bacterium]
MTTNMRVQVGPWEAEDPAADVNADGGVDGADSGDFFHAWETGGCD